MSNIEDLLSGAPKSASVVELEDSEDFTEEEARDACVTHSVEDLTQGVRLMLVCEGCSHRLQITGHKLRRKAPHLYACTSVSCNECLTDAQLVFQVDWLQEST